MTYNSTYKDRAGQSAEAKRKLLDQYRARPPVDEALAAERKATGLAREAAKAEKAAAKKAERQAVADAAAKQVDANPSAAVPKTEAEKKAARDAKYAARQARR